MNDVKSGFEETMNHSESYLNDARDAVEKLPDSFSHRKFLEFHPNGITFRAKLNNGKKTSSTYYSIGGGFVVQKERKREKQKIEQFSHLPFPIEKGTELLAYCKSEGKSISDIVLANEKSLRSENEINNSLSAIWDVMLGSMFIGCGALLAVAKS